MLKKRYLKTGTNSSSSQILNNSALMSKENIISSSSEYQYGSPSFNPILEAFMSAVEIIISRGYHVEMHPIKTDDDYIIMLHRIPYPKGRNSGSTGRPIFILPGLLSSTDQFIILPSEDALIFILADLGYDVWVINNRGTTYSRGHVTFNSAHDKAYWKFSYDEMGQYDCPAGINYVLNATGHENVTVIGYSLGVTAFFAFMHHRPEMSTKIERFIALAPLATTAYAKSPIFRFLATFPKFIHKFLMLFVNQVFLSRNESPTSFIQRRFCLKNAPLTIFCSNALFVIVGADYGNMNPNIMNAVNNHLPAGASIRTVFHYVQNTMLDWTLNPTFNQYDYGWIGNLKHYGNINPSAYDLGRVAVPVYIFHSANDALATPKNVEWAASKLPNVKQTFLIKDPRFNHIDFCFHRYVKELVYDPLVTTLPPP